jgi:outer membrane protein assembly factor BamB
MRIATAFLVATALVTILISPSPVVAKSKGGTILWEDEFAIVEVNARDGRVAAVGTIPNGAGGRTSVVRVYDADKGKLLWQQIVAAESVVVEGGTVVVGGADGVRAFDAKKGKLEWSDTPPFVVTQLYRDEKTTLGTTDDGTSVRIRTYDTKRGTVLVADRTLPRGIPFRTVLTFGGGKMFTVTAGEGEFDGFPIRPCKVTAYSVASGERLWETTQPYTPPPPSTSGCTPFTIFANRSHVVIGGGGHFHDEFMAQGYDAKTGAFLWEHLSGIGTCCFDAVVAIDIEARQAFVAGWTQNPLEPRGRFSAVDFVVRALSVDTGTLRWEARTPGPACVDIFSPCFAHARLVVADSGTVYAAGFRTEPFGVPTSGTGFIRAHDATSGKLRWQDDDVDVLGIGATSGILVVLTPGAADEDVILRAYDGK